MIKIKMSEKGEIVIPKKLREKIGLVKGRPVIVDVKGKVIEIKAAPGNIMKRIEERAKRWNLKRSDLVYGDELYEEVF